MAFLFSPRALPRYVKRYGYAFSWKRLANFVLVLASMGLSRLLGRPVVWGRPFMMMVEPTNLCNLRCPLCPSGNGQMKRPRGTMELATFQRLIDQAGGHLLLLMLWNQGEPFINKHLLEMVRYARARRIPTMTSTNGHFIGTPAEAREVVESGLDEVIISFDGVDQETYSRYRVGGQIEKVFEGTRLLARAKAELGSDTPLINLQFIVFRHNEEEVATAQRLARDLGADKFLVKTAQIYDVAEADLFLPEAEEFRRYEDLASGDLKVKGQPARGCKVLWYSTTVNWNGDVAPCCFDKDVDFPLGYTDEQAFADIWKGSAYTRFRQRLLRDRLGLDMCRNCSEGYRGMFSLVRELRG